VSSKEKRKGKEKGKAAAKAEAAEAAEAESVISMRQLVSRAVHPPLTHTSNMKNNVLENMTPRIDSKAAVLLFFRTCEMIVLGAFLGMSIYAVKKNSPDAPVARYLDENSPDAPVTKYINMLSVNATVTHVPNFNWTKVTEDVAASEYDLPVLPVSKFDVLRVRMNVLDETSKVDIFKNYPKLYTQQVDLRTLTGLGKYATPLFNHYIQSSALSQGIGEMGVLVGYGSDGRLLDSLPIQFLYGEPVPGASMDVYVRPLRDFVADAVSGMERIGLYVSNIHDQGVSRPQNESEAGLSMLLNGVCAHALDSDRTMILIENVTGWRYMNYFANSSGGYEQLTHASDVRLSEWVGKNIALAYENRLAASVFRLDEALLNESLGGNRILLGGFDIGGMGLTMKPTFEPCSLHVDRGKRSVSVPVRECR
jgi:hypothetical protein